MGLLLTGLNLSLTELLRICAIVETGADGLVLAAVMFVWGLIMTFLEKMLD